MKLEHLGLQIDSPWVHPGALNFRPPSWPPPQDWSPIRDANGIAQCIYGDSTWPLDVWAGNPLKLNFGDGKTRGARTDKRNADLLRQCTTWFLFGHRGCRNANSLKAKFDIIKPIFVTCSQEGILATDLVRFPNVLDKVAKALAPSKFDNAICFLHQLLDANDELGFRILDKNGLTRLAALAPSHHKEQTAYIPPRIWAYQVCRLRECLTDYLAHREQVKACFEYVIEEYTTSYGSLESAVTAKTRDGSRMRITNRALKREGNNKLYHRKFKLTSDKFGVTELIEKWITPFSLVKGEKQIVMFSQYIDLVAKAGLAYLLNFSLMRIQEGWDLKWDCLLKERDERFGDFYMLRGETTKTDPDADARWPVSASVILAVDAMKHIAELRMVCATARNDIDLTPADGENPHLISYQFEPWGRGKCKSYHIRPKPTSYVEVVKYYPQLFDTKEITITDEDLRIARLITPTLNTDEFKVGLPWRFGWHQLRRTGAVNMLSSEMVDDSSLQLQLKHLSRVMMLYYGRNHSRLNLSQETRKLFLSTMYQEFGRELRNLSSSQFVSPLGPARKVDIITFIKENEAADLDKAARQGKVGARRIRVGFCVKNRSCPYGGHESIAHCMGGDDGKGCPDLLADITKEPDINAYEELIDDQLRIVHPDSPRHRRLQAEKQAIRNYYDVIKT